ncbi:cation:proton antiporter [Maledivibacter halophilus]|uniref:Sodium/proton antiporter, CPA1 family n=1 Tax=Maledivibacter halophilus TaxID=36842 RepID=A0A1T5M4W3_9FIRM|nr:cation:proton antiporter [Maledivibacter halophilus]SKC83250.1 sodium/proton antiporter, CPA1 family [Maledivibacter halophilus]
MIKGIVLILLLGILANKIFNFIKLPGLLGMILVGILIGPYGFNLLDNSILNNSSDIRMLALIVILLRAGLGLNREILDKVGKIAIKMSAIPCLFEGFTITLVSYKLLHLPFLEAGMLGFIVAAVSPAVVVPSMLYLREKSFGMKKGIPIIILAGASVDDVFAITLFTTFLGLSLNTKSTISMQLLQIPIQVIGGILIGIAFGYMLYKIYRYKNIKLNDMEKLAILIISALIIVIIGDIINIAGLLGVMTLGFILLEKANDYASSFEKELNKVWFFAQIFLFVLIGAEVNIHVAWKAGLIGALIIFIGLIARSIGVIIALGGSNLNFKEKVFCTVAYSPKATVQAAIGGIPLAMGIESGNLILAIAVLAVIITAPLGAVGIKLLAPVLLEKESKGGS